MNKIQGQVAELRALAMNAIGPEKRMLEIADRIDALAEHVIDLSEVRPGPLTVAPSLSGRFVQLVGVRDTLYALDEDGEVWLLRHVFKPGASVECAWERLPSAKEVR